MANLKEANQAKIKWANDKGIQTTELVDKYGIRFTIRLLKDVTRGEHERGEWTNFPCPNFVSDIEIVKKKYQQYLEVLQRAGFKFEERPQDFVDEDTGQVVPVKRIYIYYIG